MANITIKNIPDDLYEELKKLAAVNRRSINSEVIMLIERAIHHKKMTKEEFLERARELRELTAHYIITDEELTEWKNMGRP